MSHPLPHGLAPGTPVTVLAFDIGTRTVQDQSGRVWEVSMINIDSGMEYLSRGKWLAEEEAEALMARSARRQVRSVEIL